MSVCSEQSRSGSSSNNVARRLGINLGMLDAIKSTSTGKKSRLRPQQPKTTCVRAKSKQSRINVLNMKGDFKEIDSRLSVLDDMINKQKSWQSSVTYSPAVKLSNLIKTIKEKQTYHIRVDFWENKELQRMQSHFFYCKSNDPPCYGIEPSYCIVVVSEDATPFDILSTILTAWKWDNNHSY